MKTLPQLATLLVASLLPGLAANAQELPAGPKVTLTAVTQVAPTLPQYTRVDQPLLKESVAQRSGGRIDVTLASWPERNVNGPEVLRLVRSGQVEIGAAPLTTVSGDVPLLDIVDLAGMNLTIQQARKVADAMLPVVNKELERIGIKILATYPFSGQMLFCRTPVATLNDLKGLKVRTAGPSSADLVKALGGQPVSVAFGEVYTALERGTVDCAITGSGSGNGVKWPEVSSHLYVQPLNWATAAYYVNLSWWNKQDPQVRAFLEKTFADIQERQWQLGDEATRDGVDCNVGRTAGCKMHTLARKPMTEVRPIGDVASQIRKEMEEDVLPAWVKRCGERCATVYNDVVAPLTGIRYGAK
jgi:TRAP-type C4-dicarboxylate transport system substrate-binding protein